MPTAVLIVIPKCPACVAGYVLLLTGVGVSVHTADALRWGVIVVCGAALAVLAARSAWRWKVALAAEPPEPDGAV